MKKASLTYYVLKWKGVERFRKIGRSERANPENHCDEEFYARVLDDWSIAILKLAVELLEIESGDFVYVMLYAEKTPEDDKD